MDEIKLLVLDLDNTLLSDNKTISKKDYKTLEKCLNNGIEIIFASGRYDFAQDDILKNLKLNFNRTKIADGGGTIYNENSKFHLNGFSKPEYIKVLNNLEEKGFKPFVTDGTFIYYEKDSPLIEIYQNLIDRFPEKFKEVINLSDLDNILKFILYCPDKKTLEFLKNIKIGDIKAFISANCLAEITPSKLDKWNAVKHLIKDKNYSVNNICAIGDSGNDLEMIKNAGLGLAVSNALDEVKKVADYVSESDNNHSAVTELIEKYIFKNA